MGAYLLRNSDEYGPLRRNWNYFKRGKSEINFILNIYQTIIIIWAGSQMSGGFWQLASLSVIVGAFLFVISIVIGKYSLKKLDPVTAFINPFTQDIIIYRARMALGMYYMAQGNRKDATEYFEKADKILEKWIK